MNRTAIAKTAIAFLSGAACTFVGIKIWLEQPDQDRIKMALDGWHLMEGGAVSTRVTSYSPSTLWSSEYMASPKYWPSGYEPTLAIVPLRPAFQWKPSDLQSVCFQAVSDDQFLSIRFTPTTDAAMETRRVLGEALDKFGQGPRYALMIGPEGTLLTFDTNAGSLGYFDSRLETGQDTASNMASYKLTFDKAQWPLGMGIAEWISQTHAITDCHTDDKAAHARLNNWLDRAFGAGAAKKMRAGPSRPEA